MNKVNPNGLSDIVRTLTKRAMNQTKIHALENIKEKLAKDYEMNMVLTRLKNK